MKGYATFFIIAVMTLGLLFLLLTRARTPHKAPAEEIEIAADAGDAGADGGDAGAASSSVAAEAAAPPPKPVERPLRITALGWEHVVAGAALATPDGGVTSGPPIEIAPETALDAIEARLGRTGTDAVGADIAVMPLPAFVVAYDRVRRLDLRAFAVVGFSRGRDEMHASSAGALTKAPPAADEVKLVAFAPPTAGDAAAKAAGSESATVLGLFALDLLGVAPARVRFVAPGSADAKGAMFSAVVRGASDDRKLAFSTADATALVPIVAIAPKKLLDESEGKMKEFTRAWLDALSRANKDASNVTRRLANKEAVPLGAGIGGAPEAIALLDRLGQIEPVALDKQRVYIGPDAKGAVNLDVLMTRTWQLAKAGGLTTAGAPDPLPIDPRIASIAPAPPSPKAPAEADGGADAGAATFAALPTGSTPLVVYRAVDPSADNASVVNQIGFLSAVFEKAAFRVSAKGGDKAARAIATQARDKFSLPATRLATVTAEPAGAFATVEVVSLP